MSALVELTMPLRTVSALNCRECWQAKARRVKAERATTLVALSLGPGWRVQQQLRGQLAAGVRLVVLLERAGKALLDDDNLRGALKGTRDEIARWLGVDDRDPRVRWDYDQTKTKSYAVRIRIENQESEVADAE